MNIVTPYTDIPYETLEPQDAYEELSKVKALQVGFGSRVLRVDRQGLWLGSDSFATAPFSVDMDGNVIITGSVTVTGYIPTGGALTDIGTGNITGTYIADGAITTAKLTATAIDGMTITGADIRTSSSGARVRMDGTTDSLRVYDASALRMALDADEFIFYDTSGTRMGALYNNSLFLTLEVDSTSYGIVFQVAGTVKASVTNAGLNVNDDILAASGGIDIGSSAQPFEDLFVDDIRPTAQSVNPTADGMMRYYVNGGTEGLRMQFGGSDFQFDATAV